MLFGAFGLSTLLLTLSLIIIISATGPGPDIHQERIIPSSDLHYGLVIEEGNCPEGWIDGSSVGMGCILPDLHHYNVDWRMARSVCSEYAEGGRLLEIYNFSQQLYITNVMRQIEEDIPDFDIVVDAWWIGLNDIDEEGHMVWPEAGSAWFTWWSPKDGDGNDEDRDCVIMESAQHKWSMWYTYTCIPPQEIGALRPVCQIQFPAVS